MVDIPIPCGMEYKSTARGRVAKFVTCERCSLEYVYFVERSAVGKGMSLLFLNNERAERQAEEEAETRVQAALMNACEPVPCPGCGHVQQHMVPRARQLRCRIDRDGLYVLGQRFGHAVFLFILASLVSLPLVIAVVDKGITAPRGIPAVFVWLLVTLLLATLWLPTAVVGCRATAVGFREVILPVWRCLTAWEYDPNAEDVEVRKQLGRTLAICRMEFDKEQAEPCTGAAGGASANGKSHAAAR